MARAMRAVATVAVAAGLVVAVDASSAQEVDAGLIEIPITTVVRAEPGSTTVLATVDVPAELVGSRCEASSRADNNASVHPGNDIVVTSGESSVRLADVERAPGVETTAEGILTLGTTASAVLEMGSDGVFSGGVTGFVVLRCFPAESTTTSTTTTVAGPTSSQAPPTSSTPPSSTTTSTTTTTVAQPPTQQPPPSPVPTPVPANPTFTG